MKSYNNKREKNKINLRIQNTQRTSKTEQQKTNNSNKIATGLEQRLIQRKYTNGQ